MIIYNLSIKRIWDFYNKFSNNFFFNVNTTYTFLQTNFHWVKTLEGEDLELLLPIYKSVTTRERKEILSVNFFCPKIGRCRHLLLKLPFIELNLIVDNGMIASGPKSLI